MTSQSSNYANDTVLLHLRQSTNPDLHIVTWAGDYQAAKQITDFVCSKVEQHEYDLSMGSRSCAVTDTKGHYLYIPHAPHFNHHQPFFEVKQWLGDKVLIVNARDYRPRNINKDTVLIMYSLLFNKLDDCAKARIAGLEWKAEADL